MKAQTNSNTATHHKRVLTEADLVLEKGLPAKEVDRRLVTLARAHRRTESALSYYLKDVDERQLYLQYGHGNTIDYARERLGFEERKTRSLLNIARSFEKLPKLNEAFQKGEIPWTKAREVAKVARPETDREWLEKTQSLSNRQLERQVRQTLPPVRKKTLVLVLEGERLDAWEQTREACERLAGKTLSDIEVFDLMTAETLCTYALTPAFGTKVECNKSNEGDGSAGGYARRIAERDNWQCTRPGCSNRSALTGNHIIPRSRGGPDDDYNLHLVCASCHNAITEGRLKVSGRAPDGLTWEGPFGVIEKPLPLAPKKRDGDSGGEALLVRESPPIYGGSNESYDRKQFIGCFSDHVIRKAALREAVVEDRIKRPLFPQSVTAAGFS
jgi:hypothetical protein